MVAEDLVLETATGALTVVVEDLVDGAVAEELATVAKDLVGSRANHAKL